MFTLIIIRVGLGYTVTSATGGGKSLSTTDNQRTGGASSGGMGMGSMGYMGNGGGGAGGQEYAMRPVAISVQVQREQDGLSLEDSELDQKRPVDSDLEAGVREHVNVNGGKGVAH